MIPDHIIYAATWWSADKIRHDESIACCLRLNLVLLSDVQLLESHRMLSWINNNRGRCKILENEVEGILMAVKVLSAASA